MGWPGVGRISRGVCIRYATGRPCAARLMSTQGGAGKPVVVVLSGNTGVGKSAAAVRLAKALNGEIITADSVQVYRGADIGSNKPLPREMEDVPHHLMSSVEPNSAFSAGQFAEAAEAVAKDIIARGRVPIVCGGTGFYMKTLMHGTGGARQDPKIRDEVAEVMWNPQQGWPKIIEMVQQRCGPEMVDYLEEKKMEFRTNTRALTRYVEAVLSTNKPLPEMPTGEVTDELKYDFRCFFLTVERILLYRMLDFRAETMIQNGLLGEVYALLKNGLSPQSMLATAINYKETIDYLTVIPTYTRDEQVLFYEYLAKLQASNRRVSRNQSVYFRSEPMFRWIDVRKGGSALPYELYDGWLPPEICKLRQDPRRSEVRVRGMKMSAAEVIDTYKKASANSIAAKLDALNPMKFAPTESQMQAIVNDMIREINLSREDFVAGRSTKEFETNQTDLRRGEPTHWTGQSYVTTMKAYAPRKYYFKTPADVEDFLSRQKQFIV